MSAERQTAETARRETLDRRFVDVFAGCGGLSLGLKRAGWQGVL
ncbi:MAG: DNA cytosine methyltransferase, partial [Gammaproteobacteria bacterium]|nr:DNA cytosine methyltransferase [Gammaproteobacteria bacterium]